MKTHKAITAQGLLHGRVLFFTENEDWSADLADAHLLEDGPRLEAALIRAKQDEAGNQVVAVYTIDVDVEGTAVRRRERIRSTRPTVDYGPKPGSTPRTEATDVQL